MKKWKVPAKSVDYFYIEVEAEDKHEAWQKAEQVDGGDFQVDDGSYWEVLEPEEIK